LEQKGAYLYHWGVLTKVMVIKLWEGKFMKKLLVYLVALSMVFAFISFGQAASKGYVGIAMPTKSSERWIKDGGTMKDILEKRGYQVDLQFAEDDIPTQKAQIENMITKGAKVLVIAAIDGSTLSATLTNAAKGGVKVISYDRLLVNTDAVSYYATFDNRKVGQLQAQSLVEGLKKYKGKGPWNVELFAGSPDDTNSFYFYSGAMDVLNPLMKKGQIVVPSKQIAQDKIGTLRWLGDVAQTRMDGILAANYAGGKPLHGVLSPYDGISRGVLSSLISFGFVPGKNLPIVTGQDAEAASIKLIKMGQQYSTILKDTRDLAKVAADMVDAVLKGSKPQINDTKTYNNNVKIVPSYLLTPYIVTKDNYQKLVIDSGYLKESDIK
jgi:putative multiple sugar transport system substrate-binding protein